MSYHPPPQPEDPSEVRGADYWESVYQSEARPGWDLQGPAPPLARILASPYWPAAAPARVLVPGCGHGHDAEVAAKLGHRVVAADLAPTAHVRATERLAPYENSVVVLGDFFELAEDPAFRGSFDLVLEHTFLCAIDPAQRGDYWRAVRELLAPGGHLVGLFYNHGRPAGPPFDITPAAVRRFAGDAGFTLRHWELAPDSIERRRGMEWLGIYQRGVRRESGAHGMFRTWA